MWAQGKINIKRGEMMKISKEEKEVMKVLEELVSSTLADSDGCLLFKTDYDEPLNAIHKIYKPLLEEKDKEIGEKEELYLKMVDLLALWEKNNRTLEAENDRLKKRLDIRGIIY